MKKYKDDILNCLLFGAMIFCIVMARELNNLDEVWIFNTARNIAKGLLPYKDFNLITVPGLPILCGTILNLFGTEMIIMRILAVIVDTVIIFMIYKILKLIKVNKYASTLITLIIAALFMDSFCIDYNFIVLMIALISLYFELKNYYKTEEIFNYNIKAEILLGILAGISITMKQTTGICYAIAFIGYKLLAVRTKDEFKRFLKIAVTRVLAVLIPVIFLILYLTYSNIMDNFIDYAILGIKEFSNSKPYINLLKGDLWYLAVLVPIIIVSSFMISMKKKEDILTILFAYSVSTIVVVYPIADTIHFLIAGTIAVITGIYMVVKVYQSRIEDKIEKQDLIWITSFVKAFTIILMICLAVISIFKAVLFLKDCSEYDELKNLKYIPVSQDLKERIFEVGEYIKNNEEDVYIIDATAAIYMIPLDRYNKNYDMFLIGNIGSDGSQGIIKDLQNKQNAVLLIQKEEHLMNWQTPMEVIKYIKDNYIKNGEIQNFDIYKKGE